MTHFHTYFFVSNIIAQTKETRIPNNTSDNTTPSPVTTKYAERIKENKRETIKISFIISKQPFGNLLLKLWSALLKLGIFNFGYGRYCQTNQCNHCAINANARPPN